MSDELKIIAYEIPASMLYKPTYEYILSATMKDGVLYNTHYKVIKGVRTDVIVEAPTITINNGTATRNIHRVILKSDEFYYNDPSLTCNCITCQELREKLCQP